MKIRFPLNDLAKLVKNSDCLTELDISGNDCQPLDFVNLLKALAFNKNIFNLNLSWNKILDSADWNDNVAFELSNFTLYEMWEERELEPTLIFEEPSAEEGKQEV